MGYRSPRKERGSPAAWPRRACAPRAAPDPPPPSAPRGRRVVGGRWRAPDPTRCSGRGIGLPPVPRPRAPRRTSYSADEIRTRPNFISITARSADARSGSPSPTKFRKGRNFVGSVSPRPRGASRQPETQKGSPGAPLRISRVRRSQNFGGPPRSRPGISICGMLLSCSSAFFWSSRFTFSFGETTMPGVVITNVTMTSWMTTKGTAPQ